MTSLEGSFARTGEMGQRIARHDWGGTALGEPAAWPMNLRSTTSTLLGSRYPMILLWGPELIQLYNDAYIGLIGAKHPDALGRSIRETLAESWQAIGPMIHAVMSTGVPNWVAAQQLPLLRAGYLEESYFSLSYSAVDDDRGEIRGMLCVCSEVTQQVIGARRLQLLRELAVATSEATTVDETCGALGRILAAHPLDVPFAALYLRAAGGALERHVDANLDGSAALLPERIEDGDAAHARWSLAGALAGTAVFVDGLEPCLGHPAGPFATPVRHASVSPIRCAGATEPAGVLIAAASPARELDEGYRTFYELLARQVSTAIDNARSLEHERRRAEALAELDRAKTAFFTNVSHELRTPLTLILGPIEDALAQPQPSLDADGLATVQRSALRLLRLVNGLLDFARLEGGGLRARFRATDLAALTVDLTSSFRSAIERAGLRLIVDCPPLAEPIYVDVAHWEKIVWNLLSNALKFTLTGEIAVSLRPRGDRVELTVRDTGAGIPAHELPRMFERFHRVEGAPSRSIEGTGIGLSLVHELVKLNGGSVGVTSVLGQGSAFTVAIPLGSTHLPAAALVSPDELVVAAQGLRGPSGLEWLTADVDVTTIGARSDDTTSGIQRDRVLVVDDNPDMRAYLTRLLQGRWRVDVAADGHEALALALAQPPDLVLSDIMMPGLDGVGLLRELRADVRTREVPVVLLSARAGEESLVEGLQTGADDYLTKPFSARELLARVQTHLTMAGLRRQWARELERANEGLEAFSYSVSHDLRTPLRAIDGFSRALQQEYGDRLDGEGARYLDRVRAAAQRMDRLIDDLLALARISRTTLRRTPVDLAALARPILAELQARQPERAVDIALAGGLTASADASLLAIVLENLLGNAWKFTARRARARIELGELARDGERVFFVRDDGAGFDMAHAQRLFVPFQRLHPQNEFEGVGIGLATVQRIVTLHGGRIWAEAAVDRGATIYFTLEGSR